MGAKCTITNCTNNNTTINIWNPESDFLLYNALQLITLPPLQSQETQLVKGNDVILQLKHTNAENGQLCHYVYRVKNNSHVELQQLGRKGGVALVYKNESNPISNYYNYDPFPCILQPGNHEVKAILETIQQLKASLSIVAMEACKEKKIPENNEKYKDDIALLKELTQFLHPYDKQSILKIFLPVALGGSGLGCIARDEFMTAISEFGFMEESKSSIGNESNDLKSKSRDDDDDITANYQDTCWGCCYHISLGIPAPKHLEQFLKCIRGYDDPPPTLTLTTTALTPSNSNNQMTKLSQSTMLMTSQQGSYDLIQTVESTLKFSNKQASSGDMLSMLSPAMQSFSNPGIISSFTKKLYEMVPGNITQLVASGKAEFVFTPEGFISQVRSVSDHGKTFGNVSFKEFGSFANVMTPLVAIASFVLGQYHLHHINETLSHITNTLDEINIIMEIELCADIISLENSALEIPDVLFEALMENNTDELAEVKRKIEDGLRDSIKVKEKVKMLAFQSCKNLGWKENSDVKILLETQQQLEKSVTHLVLYLRALRCNILFILLKLFELSFYEGRQKQKEQLQHRLENTWQELRQAFEMLQLFATAKFTESWPEATVKHIKNLLMKLGLYKHQQQQNKQEQQFHTTIKSLCRQWELYTIVSPQDAQQIIPILLNKQVELQSKLENHLKCKY